MQRFDYISHLEPSCPFRHAPVKFCPFSCVVPFLCFFFVMSGFASSAAYVPRGETMLEGKEEALRKSHIKLSLSQRRSPYQGATS